MLSNANPNATKLLVVNVFCLVKMEFACSSVINDMRSRLEASDTSEIQFSLHEATLPLQLLHMQVQKHSFSALIEKFTRLLAVFDQHLNLISHFTICGSDDPTQNSSKLSAFLFNMISERLSKMTSLQSLDLKNLGLGFLPHEAVLGILEEHLKQCVKSPSIDLSQNRLDRYNPDILLRFSIALKKLFPNDEHNLILLGSEDVQSLIRSNPDYPLEEKLKLSACEIIANSGPSNAGVALPCIEAFIKNSEHFVKLCEMLNVCWPSNSIPGQYKSMPAILLEKFLGNTSQYCSLNAEDICTLLRNHPEIADSLDLYIEFVPKTPEQALAILEQRMISPKPFAPCIPQGVTKKRLTESECIEATIAKYAQSISGVPFGHLSEKLLREHKNAIGLIEKLKIMSRFYAAFSPIPVNVLTDNLMLAVLAEQVLAVRYALKKPVPADILLEAFGLGLMCTENSDIEIMLAVSVGDLKKRSRKQNKARDILVFMGAGETAVVGRPQECSILYFLQKIRAADPHAKLTVVYFFAPDAKAESDVLLTSLKLPSDVRVLEMPGNLSLSGIKELAGSDIIFDRLSVFEGIRSKSLVAAGLNIIQGDYYLPIFNTALIENTSLEIVFRQNPAMLRLDRRSRVYLTSLALFSSHCDFAKGLITSASFQSEPREKTIIFLTYAVNGLGDLSAASKAIFTLKSGHPDQKIVWIVNIPGREIVVKDMIPENVDIAYINSFSEIRSHGPLLNLLMHEPVVLISYPTFHYLNQNDLAFLDLFPRVKSLLNISEYDFDCADDHLEILSDDREACVDVVQSGVGDQSLGVFIQTEHVRSIDNLESTFLKEKLKKSYQLFFGYFFDKCSEESLYNFSSPGNFVALVSEKVRRQGIALGNHAMNGRATINIVTPIKAYHLDAVQKTLQKTGALKYIKTLEWYSHSENSSNSIVLNAVGMVLRLINPFPLSHADMITLMQHSDPLCLVTGDNSFIEAIEARKIVLYQMMFWKRGFYTAMCNALKKIKGGTLAQVSQESTLDTQVYSAIVEILKEGKTSEEQGGISADLAHFDHSDHCLLKPLYCFMLLQKIHCAENNKQKQFQLMSTLINDYGAALQKGMELLRAHLLKEKNLYVHFPAYVQARTVFPFDTMSLATLPALPILFTLPAFEMAQRSLRPLQKPPVRLLKSSWTA